MDSKSMTRKEFVTLTFTLLGGAAAASACSSSNNNSDGGTGGTHGAGGANGNSCTDPLPETQVPGDGTMHTHTFSVPASDLNATMSVMITTSQPMPIGGATISPHTHIITLTTADLAMLKGGGQVTVTSDMEGSPIHSHMFVVSCGAATGTGGTHGSAGANGSAGTNGSAGANGSAGTNGGAGISGAAGTLGIAGHY